MGGTTPREIFTALINCISSIPLLDDEQPPRPPPNPICPHSVLKQEEEREEKKSPANPLRRVPISHRHLLITLHVLFPGMVLPALDLLDRRLVTRLVLDPALSRGRDTKSEENKIKREHGNFSAPAPAPTPLEETESDYPNPDPDSIISKNKNKNQQLPNLYIVYSSAQPSRPRKPTTTTSSAGIGAPAQAQAETLSKQKYLVRLKAWNCTCAAFAFASVQEAALVGDPADMITSHGGFDHEEEEKENGSEAQRDEVKNDDDDDDDSWSFGGLTLPEEGNMISTCKHLLACLLAERWDAALGEYVVDRRVGREEMAGVVADI